MRSTLAGVSPERAASMVGAIGQRINATYPDKRGYVTMGATTRPLGQPAAPAGRRAGLERGDPRGCAAGPGGRLTQRWKASRDRTSR